MIGMTVDAAIAGDAVLAVVEPQSCGLGGDPMFLNRRGRTALAINGGNGHAPAQLSGGIASDGGGTAAGFVAGLLAAHEHFG